MNATVITLTVIAFNDAPADGTLRARFDELGGSIGRADTNQLVLPDPDRTISRVAAQVVYRNGAFAIVDRGSNPITINGRALGSGREAPLQAGDRVRIGGYELSASAVPAAAAASAVADDPFSGLLGPGTAAPTPAGVAFVDPLMIPAPPPAPTASSAGSAAPAAAGGIPADWDPFAPDSVHVRAGRPVGGRPSNALGLDLGAAAPEALVPGLGVRAAEPSSLDQLFGLGPSTGGDPLANSMLDAPMAKPNMAADADPLRSLKSAPKASGVSEADNLSDLNRPFIPPTYIQPATPPMTPPAAAPAVPVPAPAPAALPVPGAVMSWDASASASHTVIRARAERQTDLPPEQPPPIPDFEAPPRRGAEPEPAPAPRAAASSGDVAVLLEAFKRGLKSPGLDMPALTPELMELAGALLHEAARGTVDLLTIRATFKRELRAQATTIVPRNNNPLKFSPSAEVALQHMLSPPTRGFMPAVAAMRDAYDDLRAHQFGFVAGLPAALEGVLHRFDPAALETQLTQHSFLHSLVPSSRKARLWEVFTEHYARIRGDASEDFHNLFGKAFLAAYEAQIERLQEAKDKGAST